jgi:hypothetical protein
MGNVMRFTFREPADLQTVEHDMTMALLVAEFLYGKPRVRLEAEYAVSAGDSSFVLEISGPAGETAAQIFAGFCSVRFGEEGYYVERCKSDRASAAASGVPK